MNAKIGDFGLAALLVTGKDYQTIRRTTLCGTPNYIAPEILEKGEAPAMTIWWTSGAWVSSCGWQSLFLLGAKSERR